MEYALGSGRIDGRRAEHSPEYNPDEAIWAWAREEGTAKTCLGTTAAVQEQPRQCFAGLPTRVAEVQPRCRRTLHALAVPSPESHPENHHVAPIGASV